ncbi:mycofactocin system GMC family oxidoreductase MftG [Rhodococcus sp. USK13]|uniref:mycofactocin dehydrogenase MftG n=1 Tax=Rhodococcus sp. USK13 TaxID=2806442 RepID=UPI001BCFE03C|nr:mycofactocin system GMC family oxidoreductase MftG [Rhodococcus sp. USK13]
MAGPVRAADVVVVGGGSSGCVVAARLSEDPGRTVVLLESGPGYRSAAECSSVLDYRTLPVGPRSPYGDTYGIELTPGIPSAMVRGHVLGGSGAVNGAYFIRGTAPDFDRWPPSWSYDHVLPFFRALETDVDFEGPLHGAAGPVPVRRQPADRLSAVSAAFHLAALDLGFAEEADKNGRDGEGIGPVPLNVGGGRRVSTASAYLLPALDRPNLTVDVDSHVVRILFSGTRAVGVEVDSGGARRVVRADRVVLAAGAVETPVLLMHSGIGPAEHLRDNGIRPVTDAPGVGSDFSDHPEVGLPYRVRAPLRRDATSPVLEAVLNVGQIEIRPYTASFDVLVPGSGQPVPRLGIGVMTPESRGRIRLASPHRRVRPRIEYRYAETDSDRRALRDGVALGVELLRSPAFHSLVEPVSEEVSDNAVRAHLGTSQHLCGSCRMGNSDDAGAVVDERCNVRGIDGLTIADTSVFPVVPSRGPHATAVMVAERVSTFLSG